MKLMILVRPGGITIPNETTSELKNWSNCWLLLETVHPGIRYCTVLQVELLSSGYESGVQTGVRCMSVSLEEATQDKGKERRRTKRGSGRARATVRADRAVGECAASSECPCPRVVRKSHVQPSRILND